MGSSIVMMCPSLVWLMALMRQASVVDLPLPAEPVTRTSPFISLAEASTSGGMFSFSGSGKPKRITRMTAARLPR